MGFFVCLKKTCKNLGNTMRANEIGMLGIILPGIFCFKYMVNNSKLEFISNPYRAQINSSSIFCFVGHIETCTYSMADFTCTWSMFDLVIVIDRLSYSPSHVIPNRFPIHLIWCSGHFLDCLFINFTLHLCVLQHRKDTL